MTRTCHLKCDACGRETYKHETLEALQTDTRGWHWHGNMHVCSDCQRPTRADVDHPMHGPRNNAGHVAAELDWSNHFSAS